MHISLVIALLSITLLLAYLPNSRKPDVRKLWSDTILTVLIVIIPLCTFAVSPALVPYSKENAFGGAFSLLLSKSYVFYPFVLWAVAALYTIKVIRPKIIDRPWINLGLYTGATLSVMLFLCAIIFDAKNLAAVFGNILLVSVFQPVYVPIWYVISFKKHPKSRSYLYVIASLTQLPFWVYAFNKAQAHYSALPDVDNGCFVATASSKGYPFIVGELRNTNRHGVAIQASIQMLRFWEFEREWEDLYPRSHSYFRAQYNFWGRKLASRINNRFIASLFHLILKPFEWFAISFVFLKQIRLNES